MLKRKKNANAVSMPEHDGKSSARLFAEASISPLADNALTAFTFAGDTFNGVDKFELIEAMQEKTGKVLSGDLSEVEAMLIAQATVLDKIFNDTARRAALNMSEHLGAADTYLRLALKAQTQCRTTLQTLAEIKNPQPTAFIRQQNVGFNQQVNNGVSQTGVSARAGNSENQSNELLEVQHGEHLDNGAAGEAIGTDRSLETVGKIDGPKNGTRQKRQRKQCT